MCRAHGVKWCKLVWQHIHALIQKLPGKQKQQNLRETLSHPEQRHCGIRASTADRFLSFIPWHTSFLSAIWPQFCVQRTHAYAGYNLCICVKQQAWFAFTNVIWLMFTFDMTQRHDLYDTCTCDMTDSACVICLIDMTDTIHTRIYRENRASSKATRPFLIG